MNQKTTIIAVIAIVLLAVGFFAYRQMNKGAADLNTGSVQTNPSQIGELSTRGTLKSLMSGNRNVTCAIKYPEGSGSGTVFVSGNKVRGDFSVRAAEGAETMMSHMINDNGTAYVWSDGQSQGTKIKLDPNQPVPSSPAGQPQAADLEKEVDMDCKNWNVDSTKFNPPANVTFNDMTQMMQNIKSQTGTGSGPMPKMDASLCSQITDAAAKAQCLKAVGQ